MCGIYGIISLDGSVLPAPEVLDRMGEVTRHRGPDDHGSFAGDGVLLGMRRLSIIDVEGGHQPISNHDKTLWVVCNGEIYNFRELRRELEGHGHRFATSSDTEVLVHAYAQWGDGFIHKIGGMFGFALWDVRRRRLLVGRDRLGIKPLCYRDDGGQLAFASEIKALLEIPGIDAELDPAGLEQYLALGYPPAPLTLFRGIRKLPVASMLIVEDGAARIERYWELPAPETDGRGEGRWIEELRAKLEEAVVSQMVSDVPIGAFLSGGIDSSSIVGFMSRHSDEPVRTYSIGFDSPGAGQFYNELPWARQVAERFGTRHREILVRPDVVELLPRLLWHLDEPVADSAFVTTYLVSRFAREDVTVILSGVGGDELFGGYLRYLGEYYGQYYRRVPGAIRRGLLAPLARRMPADRHSAALNLSRLARNFMLSSELPFEERYRAYVGVFNDALLDELLLERADAPHDALGAAFGRSGGHDPLRSLFDVDLETQMADDLLLLTGNGPVRVSTPFRPPPGATEVSPPPRPGIGQRPTFRLKRRKRGRPRDFRSVKPSSRAKKDSRRLQRVDDARPNDPLMVSHNHHIPR